MTIYGEVKDLHVFQIQCGINTFGSEADIERAFHSLTETVEELFRRKSHAEKYGRDKVWRCVFIFSEKQFVSSVND